MEALPHGPKMLNEGRKGKTVFPSLTKYLHRLILLQMGKLSLVGNFGSIILIMLNQSHL